MLCLVSRVPEMVLASVSECNDLNSDHLLESKGDLKARNRLHSAGPPLLFSPFLACLIHPTCRGFGCSVSHAIVQTAGMADRPHRRRVQPLLPPARPRRHRAW